MEPVEDPCEAGNLPFVEAGAQSAVERDGHVAQSEKERVAGGGQLDNVDAAVGRVAMASDQSVGLHGVEVVGQRRALNADGFGDLALIRESLRFE